MNWIIGILVFLVWSALAFFIGAKIGNALKKREVQAQKSFKRRS